MGDAVSKRVRLAGSGASNDQEGCADMPICADTVLDSSALLRIERFEIGCCRRREHDLSPWSNFRLDNSP